MRHRISFSCAGAIFAAALLLIAACGKDSDKQADKQGKKQAKKQSGEEPEASTHPFAGSSPALPAELAKLDWSASAEDNQKLLGADSTYISSKAHKGVSYTLRALKDGSMSSVTVDTDVALEPALTKLWGPPFKDKDDVAYWFNPASGLRALISEYGDGKDLEFKPYQSLDSLLGDKGFALALADGKKLLGATIEELKPSWGEQLCDYEEKAQKLIDAYKAHAEDSLNRLPDAYRNKLDLCWPHLRGMASYAERDRISIGKDGRVASYYFKITTSGSVKFVEATLATLDAKLGKAVVIDDKDGSTRYYFDPASRRRVIVSVDKKNQSVGVRYSPYLPLEELLGGDGPGLGVETEGTLGTFESAQKSDPEHFQPAGVLASLVYPPTEFARFQTVIDLKRFAKRKNVHAYKVVLHFSDNPELEGRILTLLEKKFGPPKPSKRKTDKGKFIDFKGKKRKAEVWQVNEQFQITVSK